MNKIIISGHLGGDPETRAMPDGTKVTNFSVAVNAWQKGGEVTIWYRVACWGNQFDRILQHLKKGSAIFVTGTLRPPRIWTDRDGQPQVSMEIDAKDLDFPNIGRGQQGDQQASQYDRQPQSAQGQAYSFPGAPENGQAPAPVGADQSSDDDLPF